MNKKGFTLVELLAVVVILGILAMVTIPAVNRYIMNSKDDAYKIAENSMISSAKNLMSECKSYSRGDELLSYCAGFEIPEIGMTKTISLDELINYGYLDKIEDPGKSGEYCSGYVYIKRASDKEFNIDLNYTARLLCPSMNLEEVNNNVDDEFIVLVSSKVVKDNNTKEMYEYGSWVKDPIEISISSDYTSSTIDRFEYKKASDPDYGWRSDGIENGILYIDYSSNDEYQFRGVTVDNKVSANYNEKKKIKIDREGPIGNIKIVGNHREGYDLYSSNVVVSCGTVFDSYSGLDSCKVSRDGVNYVEAFTIIEENLDHTVYMKSIDKIGNEDIVSKKIGMDKTAPVLNDISALDEYGSTYYSGSWTNKDIKILGISSDNLGLDRIIYTTSDKEGAELGPGEYFEIFKRNNGNLEVTVSAIDKAGNVSPSRNFVIRMDINGPNIGYIINGNVATIECLDAFSGAVRPSISRLLTGTSDVISGVCEDRAGNTTEFYERFSYVSGSMCDSTITEAPIYTCDRGEIENIIGTLTGDEALTKCGCNLCFFGYKTKYCWVKS